MANPATARMSEAWIDFMSIKLNEESGCTSPTFPQSVSTHNGVITPSRSENADEQAEEVGFHPMDSMPEFYQSHS